MTNSRGITALAICLLLALMPLSAVGEFAAALAGPKSGGDLWWLCSILILVLWAVALVFAFQARSVANSSSINNSEEDER